jgi:hypothetical protein
LCWRDDDVHGARNRPVNPYKVEDDKAIYLALNSSHFDFRMRKLIFNDQEGFGLSAIPD